MKIKNCFFLLVLLLGLPLQQLVAQKKIAPRIYMVNFSDKNYNLYSLSDPQSFLSSRSLERRFKQNIPLTSNDIPVSKIYIDSLKNAGFKVLNVSKWLNAATIEIPDDSLLKGLAGFTFIIKDQNKTVVGSNSKDYQLNKWTTDTLTDKQVYANSYAQISLHNGQYLHNNNYKGQGKLIAVLDGGFSRINTYSSLQKLWTDNRVVLQRDLVDFTMNTFYDLSHGANVLSIMAGNSEGYLIGSAPEAQYALIRTEDAHIENSGLQYEYPVEEFNWVVGAELADSIGADIINSSLGYSLFNDSTMSYSYSQMNGKTAISTKGAYIASTKGIVVVVSAGNEGNSTWKHITAPSDANQILTVGAVNSIGNYAYFSSTGPSSDHRIKPDIVAVGQGTWVQNADASFAYGNGTSYSAPIISGLTACLWQAFPEKNNFEIMDAIKKSASQYQTPDSLIGYGIPDFQKAFQTLKNNSEPQISIQDNLKIYPNPFSKYFTLEYNTVNPIFQYIIRLTDLNGKILAEIKFDGKGYLKGNQTITTLANCPKGNYIIQFQSGSTNIKRFITKY